MLILRWANFRKGFSLNHHDDRPTERSRSKRVRKSRNESFKKIMQARKIKEFSDKDDTSEYERREEAER